LRRKKRSKKIRKVRMRRVWVDSTIKLKMIISNWPRNWISIRKRNSNSGRRTSQNKHSNIRRIEFW
jgi:hypothetical protein